jgi:hypothetical protein
MTIASGGDTLAPADRVLTIYLAGPCTAVRHRLA